jgi:hypothetical protein
MAHEHQLLVTGGDGGCVQTREKNPETGSRWKEDWRKTELPII